jgi:lambda repressor-like predicted transcriptional regulator
MEVKQWHDKTIKAEMSKAGSAMTTIADPCLAALRLAVVMATTTITAGEGRTNPMSANATTREGS